MTLHFKCNNIFYPKEKIVKAFDKAGLKRPEFTVEQGGVTAVIYREIFMSIRGDQKPIQNRTKPEERAII